MARFVNDNIRPFSVINIYIMFNCSQTKFAAIILVLLVFCNPLTSIDIVQSSGF